MLRRVAALAFVLVLSPAMLHAQDDQFTISVPSADVHKGPSIATPVIGHVARGTAMPVLRNLGSWIKVPWPDAPDRVAYVYVTMGRLAAPNTDGVNSNLAAPRGPSGSATASATAPVGAPLSTAAPASTSAAAQTTMAPRPHRTSHERVVIRSQQGATAISHVVGFGGVVGSMSTFGATARTWSDNRLGIQFAFTRDSMTSDAAAGRMTTTQLEPAVVYGLFDSVTDYFWIRPYVGSGVSFRHQTLHQSTPVDAEVGSDNGVGFRVFGGAEMTFAGAPRFALSVDLGYRHFPTPFAGFEPGHVGLSLFGHWYVK